MTYHTGKDIAELRKFLDENIVAINIVELVEWYSAKEDRLRERVRELEQQLREAHLNNAEKLFRDLSGE